MFRRLLLPLRCHRGRLTLSEALKDKDLLIVDVRSPEEVAAGGSCPGALNIPLPAIPNSINQLGSDKSRPIITYCARGIRAADATSFLKSIGYSNSFSTIDGNSVQKLLESATKPS